MKRSVAYSIFFIIFFGIGFFAVITNSRFKNQTQTTDFKDKPSENEVIQIIFKEEFSSNKKPE